MIAEFGVLFLALALMVAILQGLYLLPMAKLRLVLGAVLPYAAYVQNLLVTLALALLITLRLNSDFSVISVVEHSNLSLPTLYKIAGTWGNHEGSMLLWVFVLSLFGAMLPFSRSQNSATTLFASSVQSVLCAGFLLFILTTSNPFARRFPPVVDGQALNPILQDMALSLHPPLLYLGYVGFSIVFSMAIAALITGSAGKVWAEIVQPWIVFSWGSLTLGIGLGSWWAYRELGWGGWWFWDAVENASLMPWLAGTALLHTNLLLKKRGKLSSWVILLSIITFGLSLLGTFLVRSGAITSVHSFASDPKRGIFILAYMMVAVGGAFLLYSLRIGKIKEEENYADVEAIEPFSRAGLMIVNNLFILVACATVVLGTLYPIIAEIFLSEKITVGAPYFEATFAPIMAIPLLFAAVAPFVPWRGGEGVKKISAKLLPAFLSVVACSLLVFVFSGAKTVAALIGFGLAAWLGTASVSYLFSGGSRMAKCPVFLGHFGAACMVAGIVASSLYNNEEQAMLGIGDTISIAGYVVEYAKSDDVRGANYQAQRATLVVKEENGRHITTLFPEYRKYEIRGSTTSETGIYSGITGDLYSAVGEIDKNGKIALRLYYKPMIYLIWLGFVLICCSGFFALINKRIKR